MHPAAWGVVRVSFERAVTCHRRWLWKIVSYTPDCDACAVGGREGEGRKTSWELGCQCSDMCFECTTTSTRNVAVHGEAACMNGLSCKDMRVRFELQGDSRSWMWRTGQACKANEREPLWNTKSEITTATARLRERERERASYIMSLVH